MQNMNCGDLIFVQGKSPVAKTIEAVDGKWSHVAIAASKTHIFESQGLQLSRFAPFYFDEGTYEVIPLNLSEIQQNQARQILIQLSGVGYDWGAVFGIGVRKLLHKNWFGLWNNPKEFYCSEVADIFLYGMGLIEDDEYLGDYSPNELYGIVRSKFCNGQ